MVDVSGNDSSFRWIELVVIILDLTLNNTIPRISSCGSIIPR